MTLIDHRECGWGPLPTDCYDSLAKSTPSITEPGDSGAPMLTIDPPTTALTVYGINIGEAGDEDAMFFHDTQTVEIIAGGTVILDAG